MIVQNPYTDLQEAYKNRARIEKMRKTENIRLRTTLSEFDDPHYPIMVRKPNYQHKSKPTASTKTRMLYQSQAHMIFKETEILPY